MSQTETLRIEGMSCQHCVRAVRSALEGVPGVTIEDVQVGTARVRIDDGEADRSRLVKAIEGEGYAVVD